MIPTEHQRENIDTTHCDIHLDDNNTSPIQARRRLQRLNTTRTLQSRRKDKIRWTPSLEQEYFTLTRGYSNTILTKLTGKGPEYRRTVRWGTYDKLQDMDWLEDYDGRTDEAAARGEAIESGTDSPNIDRIDNTPNCIYALYTECRSSDHMLSSREGIG